MLKKWEMIVDYDVDNLGRFIDVSDGWIQSNLWAKSPIRAMVRSPLPLFLTYKQTCSCRFGWHPRCCQSATLILTSCYDKNQENQFPQNIMLCSENQENQETKHYVTLQNQQNQENQTLCCVAESRESRESRSQNRF